MSRTRNARDKVRPELLNRGLRSLDRLFRWLPMPPRLSLSLSFSCGRLLPVVLLVPLVLLLLPVLAAGAAQVTLAWDPPSSGVVDGYRLFSRQEGQTYSYSQPAWQGTATTCVASNLGTATYFVVRAYNSSGESGDSNEAIYQPAPVPGISRTPSFLSASCTQGTNAPIQSFQVSNSGGGTLSYTVSTNASWLSCSPASGTSTGASGTVTVSYATSGLAAGTYSAVVTISASGASNSPQTLPVSLTVVETLPLEVGEVVVDHTWKPITFKWSFSDPVIVATILTTDDSAPAVVRVRNLTGAGCEIRIQEWNYLDGVHGAETVGYLVIERGRYTLADGTQVEAGRLMTNKTGSFAVMAFSQPFRKVPVMAAAVSTVNEADTVTDRLRKISTQGFEFRMQEQKLNAQKHLSETICYVAWEPSSGTVNGMLFEVGRTQNSVTDAYQTIKFLQDYSEPPVVIADMQTTDGGDTANVRCRNGNLDGIEVQIDEEQSRNSETVHTTEVVGYLVFGITDLH